MKTYMMSPSVRSWSAGSRQTEQNASRQLGVQAGRNAQMQQKLNIKTQLYCAVFILKLLLNLLQWLADKATVRQQERQTDKATVRQQEQQSGSKKQRQGDNQADRTVLSNELISSGPLRTLIENRKSDFISFA